MRFTTKYVVFLAIAALAPSARAQPAPPSLTPKPKVAVVDAEVILIGCSPMRAMCGYLMSRQPMAIKVTKVDSGPMRVGDTPVVDVVTCFEGPLLRKSNPGTFLVELDQTQIRAGSKIHLELEVYASGGNLATTDKITVTKL